MRSNGCRKKDSYRTLLFVLLRCPLSTEDKILVENAWKYYSYLKEPKNAYILKALKAMIYRYGVLFEGVTCHLKREQSKDPPGDETLMDLF